MNRKVGEINRYLEKVAVVRYFALSLSEVHA